MGWRDFNASTYMDNMDNMDNMTIAPSFNPYNPFNPPVTDFKKASADYPTVVTPKAWLEDNELRVTGVFPGEWPGGGLAPEIAKLTGHDAALQRRLLLEHCGIYQKPYWQAVVERWDERAAIIQYDGGINKEQAEDEAAASYHLLAFLPELRG